MDFSVSFAFVMFVSVVVPVVFLCLLPFAFVVSVSVVVPVVEEAHFSLIFYDTKIVNYVHIYKYIHVHKHVSFYFAFSMLFLWYEIHSASVFFWGSDRHNDFLFDVGIMAMAEKPHKKIGFCTLLCTHQCNGLKYSRFFILYRNIFAFFGAKYKILPPALYISCFNQCGAVAQERGQAPRPVRGENPTCFCVLFYYCFLFLFYICVILVLYYYSIILFFNE